LRICADAGATVVPRPSYPVPAIGTNRMRLAGRDFEPPRLPGAWIGATNAEPHGR
jgi:hypothetical protein